MLIPFLNSFSNQLLDAITKDSNESKTPRDKLIGGLLTADFDEGTEAYKEATEHLVRDEYYASNSSECRYIVWIARDGLGNQLLTLTSTFLYALLTKRIILVDQRKDIRDLLCEPFPEYSDNLKNMFWERPSSTGEIIEVFQPSGERVQQTNKKLHDQKVLAEIYLLSLTDNIVTSARSTFGYVSYSLGGLKPWLLYEPKGLTTPDPMCVRSKSMEPCYHNPPSHGCEADWRKNSEKILPFVRHCEDMIYAGLKLFDEL
ncbi:hypothetical protein AALP_AA3G317800 [Arabis alpina]|uniref:Fucosyltransferase n=1 Tax=Arabis alpina TaxID=50452 RepID=A0A087HD04_ARAAL|nr:hypothetical protein AALP_AA3G317800 [Arabis alpina]